MGPTMGPISHMRGGNIAPRASKNMFKFFFSLLFWLRQSKIAYDSSCLYTPLCHTVLVLMYHIFIYEGFQVSNTIKN